MKIRVLARLGLVSAVIVILDQVTKALVAKNLVLHETIPVISGFFNLTHIMNPGGAFGLFAQHSPEIRKFFFLFVSSLVALVILWFYKKTANTHRFLSFGLAAIFAGAVGTLLTGLGLERWLISLTFIWGLFTGPPLILPILPSPLAWLSLFITLFSTRYLIYRKPNASCFF